MILGIGNDIVQIRRIASIMAKYEARFTNKYFTKTEREFAEKHRKSGTHINAYAKRFAAKEAVAKALGTGFQNGIAMRDIGVTRNELGAPTIALQGKALERLHAITPKGHEAIIRISLSDDPPIAQAFVIIEALKC